MDLVGHFERYLSDDDLVWECAVCMSPKVPFVTLAPCGHSVCRDCSTAVTTCPLCRAPIQSRVESQELTQQALSRIIYRCPKDLCGFRGNEVEARNHVCRVYRFRAIGPNIPDDEFTTLIKQLPTSATDDEVVTAILEAERRREAPKPAVDNNIPAPTVVVQPSSPLQAVTSPAQPRAPATLYWDYDNLLPHFLGTTTVAFFTNMKDALSSKGVFVRDSFAYLVAGKDYQKDPDKLKDLQVAMRLSGTKREQADRDMSQDMRKRARELQEYGRRGVFVIVSSDKDFTADVKELSEHHDVWVVHNAVQGSDHEKTLKVYATGVLHVSSFLRAVTPPRYRGMLRTVSEEQVATVHRSQRSPARSPARSPQARPATLSPQARPVAALPAATEQTQAATVKVGEVSVPVSYLLRNAGLDRLTNVAGGAAPPGRWCNNHDPHNAATCNYIHIATGYIVVEYVARPVTDFVQNAAVTFLQTQACRQGKWCRNESPHDPTNCHFLHPAPGVSHPLGLRVERVDAPASPHAAAAPLATTSAASPTAGSVLVDGKATPVEQLVPNRALEFLLAHPNCNGRTCNNTTPHHDPSTCSYVHHKQVTTVTIEGRAVDRSRLIGNAALKYLTEHPNAQGKWCTNKRPHDALACTYCHENGL